MNCKNERTPNKQVQRNIIPFQQGCSELQFLWPGETVSFL